MAFNIKMSLVARLILHLVLFSICLYFFTYPSWKKFTAQKTIIATKEVRQDDIPAPAVTVCIGFVKNTAVSPQNTLQEFCKDHENITKCIDTKTYNLSDAVIEVRKGVFSKPQQLLNPKIWITDFTVTNCGKCFTLNSSITMGIKFVSKMLIIKLNEKHTYRVFTHDPDFFAISEGIPNNYMVLDKRHGSAYYKMRIVRHKNLLNCNSDPSYKFSACVKKSFALEIGCRLPWDLWTDKDFPVCDTFDQFR